MRTVKGVVVPVTSPSYCTSSGGSATTVHSRQRKTSITSGRAGNSPARSSMQLKIAGMRPTASWVFMTTMSNMPSRGRFSWTSEMSNCSFEKLMASTPTPWVSTVFPSMVSVMRENCGAKLAKAAVK